MKRPAKGSTIKQYAYATRRLNGQGGSKKEIAKLSGYSTSMAENAKYKIEATDGYKNAVIELAHKSNNLLLAVMHEFETRGLSEFSNKDLNSALNAISGAWDRIERTKAPSKLKTPEGNRLRSIFTERVETRTVSVEPVSENPANATDQEPKDAEFTEVNPEEPLDLNF